MASSSLDQVMERTRSLIEAAYENITTARELREVSQNIRYDNSDLREFLREARLLALSRYNDRMEQRLSGESLVQNSSPKD